MDKDTRRERHFFVLTEYEQEEEYLRRMHGRGWRFERVTLLGRYDFSRCEPEDVVYKLDFRPLRGEDREAFLTIYRDYGWEYIQDLNDYSYFRKPAGDAQEGDLEIFSDGESRLAALRRIFTVKMLPILVIFLCVIVPNLTVALTGGHTAAGTVLTVMWGVLLAVYLYVLIRCGVGFYRLGKKYSRGK